MGVQYALDSLKKSGLNATVYVVDCSGDTATFDRNLAQHKDADLLIGPFFPTHLNVAARFCKQNKIRMVNPLTDYAKALKNNPYVINAVTSDLLLMKGMATYLSQDKEVQRIILVKPSNENNQYLYNAFRDKLNQLNAVTHVKFIEATLADFPNYFMKGMNTVVFYPSTDKNSVGRFFGLLSQNSGKMGSGKLEIYGLMDWQRMDKIKNYYKNAYDYHFSIANDFDYTKPQTIQLLKGVRGKYNTDLTKTMAQGFDVAYYFINHFLLKRSVTNLVLNSFNFKQLAPDDGYQNTTTFIFEQVNFDYKLLKMIE